MFQEFKGIIIRGSHKLEILLDLVLFIIMYDELPIGDVFRHVWLYDL